MKRPKRILPKHQRPKKKRRKGVVWWFLAFCLGIFIFFAVLSIFVRLPTSPSYIYNEDLLITGNLGNGVATPNFGLQPGNEILIIISNLELKTGHSLLISLQGGGADWQRVAESNTTLRVQINSEGQYNILFRVNSVLINGEIQCNAKIRLY